MRVAVIGTGRMGRAAAGRLLDTGHHVAVWNRTPERAGPVVSRGATLAHSPAEGAAMADDAVLLSLSDDEAVMQVVTATDGVLAGLRSSAVLVDTSTVAPGTSRRVAGDTPGHRFVALPIAGAPAQVARGEARLLAAGPRSCVDALAPLLADLAAGTTYCGQDPGAATTLKLVNNYLLMGGLALVSDAVALAEAGGVDTTLLWDLLGSSPMVPAGLHNRLDNLRHGRHQGWFTTALGAKDVGLAATLAAQLGLDLPLMAAVLDRYRAAMDASLADEDITAVVEVARRRRSGPGHPAP